MTIRRTIQIAFLLILACSFVLPGCSNDAKLGKGDFFNLRKMVIHDTDKQYMLKIMRAMLEKERWKKEEDEHPILFKSEKRAIFVSLIRPNENVLCTFGIGEGLIGAMEAAADKMRRLAVNENISSLKIRLDVVDESTDIRSANLEKRWKIKDRIQKGIIFDTTPPYALLPDEIIFRNVIDHKGRFNTRRARQVIKDRGIGTKVMDQIKNVESLDYCYFTRITFMESDNPKKPKTLLNGRPKIVHIEATALLESAKKAGEYLKRNIHPDGRFAYIYYPQMDRESENYNLLRHAGTAYAMTELYEVTGDEQLLANIRKTHVFLLERMGGPNPKDSAKGIQFKTLWNKKEGEAKAGGAALCVIALAKYTTVTGDKQHLPLMQDLARFIQHQTEENGHLLAKYYMDPEAARKPFDSIYYPGECVLALTRLYQIDQNPDWIKTASKLVDFMVFERDKSLLLEKLPHDHWLCIAINELYPITKNDAYKDHVFKIGESIWRMARKTGRKDWIGSFYTPPRSTPSATRNEATIALYSLAEKLGEDTGKWYEMSILIAKFDQRMQMNDISGMFLKHPDKATGAFVSSFENPEIRIDYVQHNISALLGLWKIQLQKKGKKVEDFLVGRKKHQQ